MSLNPTNKPALDPKVTGDNGGDFAALLQPEHQAPYTAVSATPTQAQVTAIRDACILAGIMKSS